MDPARIDALVILWNQGAACARAIAELDQVSPIRSITVVDNNSRLDERGIAAAALDLASCPTRLIPLSTNIGFGPATNVGWRRWLAEGEGEWVLTLPHDAYAAPGAIDQLLSIARERPRLGLLSADVGDGMVPSVDRNFGPIFTPGDAEPGFEVCDYPHGTMFLARRACLDDIGLYDERFFTYCEEADLGLRARAARWEVGLARGARVVNPRVSTPRAAADYLMERNTLLLIAKHFGAFHTTVRAVIAVGQLVDRSFRPSKRDEYFSARARLMALRDAALRRFGPPPASLLQ